ncbi:tRNA(Ile)-lysidine synthase [Candidatus Bipolaricaulis anaerobius]|uniref:tRNA(Ile)-lysidine synthase n=1 Tax=Candidatus Bipolaricaulis anaerobius TaxID=2026885 RepID=A0A2X3K6K4_9BACT|nr:tRNA lysidine(34) synthetase TilS [Candidatus Bipolaricaulis anaerobius]SQD92867.1 tRNA(Ile)-lysidine synthase [Candidatus Bipolaricaulis anaerobius]
MLARVREAIRRYGLLGPGERVLVAVSGGADSLALLHALDRLRDELSLTLTVAHLDHGIRPDTAEDLAVVQGAAMGLGLPLICDRVDVPALARATKINLEEAARLVRREFLTRAAREVGAGKIALGHTRTDVAETVLLHLLRGAGPRGLRGILPSTPPYIRPLILLSREETRSFCAREGIPFRDDPTNEDRSLLRNAIRHDVLPILSRRNPRAEEALARAAGLLAEAEEALAWAADLAHAEASREDGLDLELLRSLPRSVQTLVVRRAGEEAGVSLAQRHVEAVVEGIRRGRGEVHLPHGLSARIGSGVLQFGSPDRGLALPSAWEVPGEGEAVIGELGWAFSLRRIPRPPRLVPPNPFTAYLDPHRLAPPLLVRTPRPGDRLRPFGLAGTKRVRDLLMEAHIPHWERGQWPLLCDGVGIAWVVGVRPSEDHRVAMETDEVLRVEARRL